VNQQGAFSKSTNCTTDGTLGDEQIKRIPAIFYRTEAGSEPVRAWLKEMPAADRRLIGEDIKTVEFGWPVGMPTCRPLGGGLHEVRTGLAGNRIARIFFYVDRRQRMVLLHGILKKTRATPSSDLDLARRNMHKHEKELV
jgi:phage-related protein